VREVKDKRNKMSFLNKKQKTEELPELPKIYQKPTQEEAKQMKEEIVTEEEKEIIQVVKELPQVPIRQFKNDKGQIVHLITMEEALTEIINTED
jgi:hypothetical protein